MEGYEKTDESGKRTRNEIFSNAVRAGKRTYFFDVKTTKKDEYYLTITESKKRYDKDGSYSFEKHKVFLYPEDFDKFTNGMMEALNFIKEAKQEEVETIEVINERKEEEEVLEQSELIQGLEAEAYSNLEFEDLAE
jgi:hypothetical protein